MDQVGFLEFVNPVLPGLRKCMLQGFNDFDDAQPPEIRVTVEKARAKWVSERTLALLEREFGMRGPIRMMKNDHQLSYLLVEGDEFGVGIRPKKVDEHWRSSNHQSDQQDEIRRDGYFTWYTDVYHLVLGYHYATGLQPTLLRIGLTWESASHVELITPLWNAKDGPVSVKYVQENLEPRQPKPARFRRRKELDKRRGEGEKAS